MRANGGASGLLAACALSLVACGDDAPGERDAGEPEDARHFDAASEDLGTEDAEGPTDAVIPDDAGSNSGLGAWSSLAPMPGGPRQETSVVALGSEIYVLGGFNANAQVVTTVEAYDPGLDRWRARAELPFALHHMNAAVVGDRIYVVGALTGLGFVQNPNILEYDPAQNEWSARGEMPAGTDRGSSGVCVIGSKIYLAGGYRAGAALTMFSSYDTESGQFENLPDLPEPLDHLAAASLGGVVYVIGGRNRSIDATTAAVWAFDPGRGTWTTRSPMPRARGGFAGAAALGDRIYVFGGEGNQDPGSQGVFADADAYDPASDRWFMMAAMRTPRHGTAAAALGTHIYVPGGATRQAFGAVDTNEAFSPSTP